MGKDEKELDTQCIARIMAGKQAHLAVEALFLLGPDGNMPPALRGAVFDFHQDKRGAARQREIGLRKGTAMAVYGQPALRHVDGEREFFRHPTTQVGMQALGKAVEGR